MTVTVVVVLSACVPSETSAKRDWLAKMAGKLDFPTSIGSKFASYVAITTSRVVEGLLGFKNPAILQWTGPYTVIGMLCRNAIDSD